MFRLIIFKLIVRAQLGLIRVFSLVVSNLYSESKVRGLSPASSGELSAVIARLMSKCLWSGWKWHWGVKEMPSSPPPAVLWFVNVCGRKPSWKKNVLFIKTSDNETLLCDNVFFLLPKSLKVSLLKMPGKKT